MKGRYNEIMDKVTLTPASRARILDNIRGMDLKAEAKTSRAPYWKKLMPIAAMAALVLSGVIAWQWWSKPEVIPGDGPVPLGPGTETDPDAAETVKEADSIAALEALRGYPVEEPAGLPFTPEKKTYKAYWYGMAEVTAVGEGHTAKLRKQPGSDDISGRLPDAEYPSSTETDLDGTPVSLWGIQSGGMYNAGSWQYGGYSYSLELSDAVDEETFLSIIRHTCLEQTVSGMGE